MTKQYEQFQNNVERVDSFLSLYSDIKQSKISDTNKEYKFTDILRAAVVFLHSSFEDYFRSILIEWIPKTADEKVIKDMALPGKGKNAGKLNLSDLMEYKDLTIQELIEESVKSTMNSRSFNRYSDINNWAQTIDISLSTFTKAKEVGDAIERRHKIAHEADSVDNKLTRIRVDQVTKWKDAICSLVLLIDEQIDNKASDQEGADNG